MFDQKLIECVTKVVNARVKKEYPLRDNPISEWETRMIYEVTYDLLFGDKKEKKK